MNVLRVGTKLYGYCGGYFGELYGQPDQEHHVEAIGADWVVIRSSEGEALVATGIVPEDLLRYATPEDPNG